MNNLASKITELGKKTLISVGKNNKPIYTVMAVAVANGIFKPISSLTDKKEKPEARKYAALREFATEVVAIPTYWLCGASAAKVGEKMFSKNPVKKEIAKTNMMFLGVCTAAIFIIPAVCSAALDALDKIIKKDKNQKNEPAKLDIISGTTDITSPSISNVNTNFGNLLQRPSMKVFIDNGGLKI